jgi:hypothetical protein
MPQNQNMARAGPIKKIPTGKQVVQPEPEPEPEPEVFTLDQLLVAQIVEGLTNIGFSFPEGDPRLVRLYQAKMCLIDYAGLEVLNTLEQEAAQRQAMIMAQVEAAQAAQNEQASAARQPVVPKRRQTVGEQVQEEFKTTGDVVKGLVSDEGEGEEQGEEIPAEEQAAETEVTEGEELPGDEGLMDPFDQDILSDPDAQLPGLSDVPHIGKKKPQAQPQPKAQQEGPVTQESRNVINRILHKDQGDKPQKGKPAQPKVQKETIDSVG